MLRLAFWLACLACLRGQTRRVQSSLKLANAAQGDDSELFARLLVAKNLATAFVTHSQGVTSNWSLRPRPCRIQNACHLSMSNEEPEPERRIDVDGSKCTQREFRAWYGDAWEEKWNNARAETDGKLDVKSTKTDAAFKVGDEVICKIRAYGESFVILNFAPDLQGMLHATDIGTDYIKSKSRMRDMFPKEDSVKCRIKDIDPETGQIRLAILQRRPLTDLQIGEELEGTVKNVMLQGVHVDIGAEANALLLVEDIASRRIREQFSKGFKVTCRIDEIHIEEEQIRVSCKDTEEEEEDEEEEEEEEEEELMYFDDLMYTDDVPFDIKTTKELRKMGVEYFEDLDNYTPGRPKNTIVTESGYLRRKMLGKPLRAFRIGDKVDGTVTNIKPCGAFVNVDAEVMALMGRKYLTDDLVKSFEMDKSVTCRVTEIHLDKAQLGVSCKAKHSFVPTDSNVNALLESTSASSEHLEVRNVLMTRAPTAAVRRNKKYSELKSTGQAYLGILIGLTETHGFIKCDELKEKFTENVYCDQLSQLVGRTVGESVHFDLALTRSGRPRALNLTFPDDVSPKHASDVSPDQEVREHMRSRNLKQDKPVILDIPEITEAKVTRVQRKLNPITKEALEKAQAFIKARETAQATEDLPRAREAAEATEDFNSLKVSDLKEKLKAVGLKVSGRKSELISRLKEHAAA